MACSCIKNHYSINISSTDCKTLVYEDESTWMEGEGYELPETYLVRIQIPSRSREVEVEVKTLGRTLLTSQDLFEFKDMCLPDDIYCFKVENCGSTPETKKIYTISRAYLCNTRCKIDEIIANSDLKDLESIKELDNLYQAVESSVKMNKPVAAKELLKHLNNKLKKFDCDSCGCS